MSEPIPTSYDAEFFLDPACPWCWITSRWVVNVQSERALSVRWRFISLNLINLDKDSDYAVSHRPGALATFKLMRVLHEVGCARATTPSAGCTPRWARSCTFIAAATRPTPTCQSFARRMSRRRGSRPGVRRLTSTTSPTTSRSARRPTSASSAPAANVGTPIITIGPDTESPRSFFGPVMPKAPKGDDAVALWNAVATLAHSDVAEVKRTQRGELVFD